MFSLYLVLRNILLTCLLFHLSHQQTQEGQRFLPTFTSIEPDLTLRGSVPTEKPTNGTAVNEDRVRIRSSTSFTTIDGRKVNVFDNVLDFKLLNSLQEYSHLIAEWEFQSLKDEGSTGSSPWSASLDQEPFEKSAVLSVMRDLLSSVIDSPSAAYTYMPYSVNLHVFRRGDQITFTKDNRGQQTELSVLLYFNHFWRKNDYGELLFYEENNDSFTAVSPKYNRMVIWDSSIGYITKPPSMDFKQGMICLKVSFTANTNKYNEAVLRRKADVARKMRARETLFTAMKGSQVTSLDDVANCLTNNFTTSQGRRVYVFDGLFNNDDLKELKSYVPKHGQFFFDDSLDLDSDNVQWIAGFPIDIYTQGVMWPVTQKVAEFVSGTNQWYPYDISCNLLRTYDHTRIHEDCEKLEKEWTFLVYLTTDWSEDKYGETTFLHFNGHESEHVISVIPRFGRVVIFDGFIPHSARPPSPTYSDARLTFVAKLSVNEWVARVKSLKTEFGHEEGLHQQLLGLFRNYYDKSYEEKYKEMLLENAQELKEMNDALAKRFKTAFPGTQPDVYEDAEEEDEDEEEEEEEEKEEEDDDVDERNGHHEDENGAAEYAAYDEPSRYDELYPDVQRRKEYIYSLFADKSQDVERLRANYVQFLADLKATRRKYLEQIEKLI